MKESDRVQGTDLTVKDLKKIGFRQTSDGCYCDQIDATCVVCLLEGKRKPWCNDCKTVVKKHKCECSHKTRESNDWYVPKGWIKKE